MNMDLMKGTAGAARHIDTSKLDRMELRDRIAGYETVRATIVAELDAASAPFRERIALIEDEMAAATKALRERLAQHDEDGGDIDRDEIFATDDDGNPQRCCVSGIVLLEGDRLAEDPDGNYALADVIPGWPAPAQDLPDIDEEE